MRKDAFKNPCFFSQLSKYKIYLRTICDMATSHDKIS